MSKRKRDIKVAGDASEMNKVPEPKMNIKAKILDGNTIEKKEVVDKSDTQMIADKKAFASKKEEKKNIGWVISRLDEPATIEYNGNIMRVSGRAKMKIADHTKLGKLPSGLVLKK